jgi:hypothetical protein
MSLVRIAASAACLAAVQMSLAAPARAQITETRFRAYRATPPGQCPARIQFSGSIRSASAGTYRYTFLRSDGALFATQSITFTRPGRMFVDTSWTLGGRSLRRYSGHMRFRVEPPHFRTSPTAWFTIACRY